MSAPRFTYSHTRPKAVGYPIQNTNVSQSAAMIEPEFAIAAIRYSRVD